MLFYSFFYNKLFFVLLNKVTYLHFNKKLQLQLLIFKSQSFKYALLFEVPTYLS